MTSSSDAFSEFLKKINDTPWKSLATELTNLKNKIALSIFDAKSNPEQLKQIQTIERKLLESSEGLKFLSNALKPYPGIDTEIQRQREAAEQKFDAKKPEAIKTPSWYSTVTSYVSYTASGIYTTGLYLLRYKTNVEFAARSKIIADDTISANKEEDISKGPHSIAYQKTLEALYRLSEVYNTVPTSGTVKENIQNTLASYGFPTEKAALSQQLLRKFKEYEMTAPVSDSAPRPAVSK